MRSPTAADRGDVVLGWLAKVVVVLSVLGVLGFDGASLLHTGFTASDTAAHAASDAVDVWTSSKDVQAAYAAAEVTAGRSGGTVPKKTFAIDADGTVHLQVRATAPTFVLRHIGPIKHYAVITSSGSARSVS